MRREVLKPPEESEQKVQIRRRAASHHRSRAQFMPPTSVRRAHVDIASARATTLKRAEAPEPGVARGRHELPETRSVIPPRRKITRSGEKERKKRRATYVLLASGIRALTPSHTSKSISTSPSAPSAPSSTTISAPTSLTPGSATLTRPHGSTTRLRP